MWRFVRFLIALSLSMLALVGMVRLVAPATSSSGEPPGARRQLAFLRTAIESGADTRAQAQFPEGYFFLNTLYGLSWVDLGLRGVDRDRALREARWALSRVDSAAGRAPFSPTLSPGYGIFYSGWTTWLRGGLVRLGAVDEQARFAAAAAEIGDAFDAAESPYLEAYPGQAWPVDSTVAMAALRLHDSLLPPRFGATVTRWLAGVRDRLDPATGLQPHRVAVGTGAPAEIARGSSQSVIQRFLPEIDEAFAQEQYLRFRSQFVGYPLWLGPAVREYPSGVDGPGDVDSGPLLLGASLSATTVTLGAAQVHGDRALAGALANYGELLGAPVDTPWSKRYAFGALPIGDAFVVWSKTARPWVGTPEPPPPSGTGWWRVPLLVVLAGLGALPWIRLRRPGTVPRR